MSKLQKFVFEGLKAANANNNQLGDRSKYVGASDIGNCLKKAYFSKVFGEEFSLKQLLIFQRGHLAEDILSIAYRNHPVGVTFHQQVETQGVGEFSFIKTHIDFLVETPKEMIVFECKSISSPLPNNQPHSSWLQQLQLQMHHIKQMYPNKKIRGFIVTIDVNGGILNDFEIAYNELVAQASEQRGLALWNALQEKIEPRGEISALCDLCSFKGRCEAFGRVEELPDEILAMARETQEAKRKIKELEAIVKGHNEQILAFMQAAEIKSAADDNILIKVVNKRGSEKIDTKRLKEEYPEIAEQLTIESQGSTYLTISA